MPLTAVNGIELYHEWHGPEGAPVVVFVNGLLTDTSSWTPHLPSFTPQFRCLVYDCRGQGRSTKPDQPYPPALHAADLAALCEALRVPPAAFIGVSSGGNALMHFAPEHPARVRALVLADVHAHADALMRAKLRSWATAMKVGSAPLRFDVSMPWVWGGAFLEANEQRIMKFRDRALTLPVEAALNLIRGAMDHDARDALGRISAPTLVVFGSEDVLTPSWLAAVVANGVPGARLEAMVGGGHAAALEDPDAFSRLVLSFLAELR